MPELKKQFTMLQVLQIMTPEDVLRMSKVSQGADKTSLTQIFEEENFPKKEALEKKAQEGEGEGDDHKQDGETSSGTLIPFKILEEMSATQFLLEQRRRNSSLLQKLKKRGLLEEYKRSSKVNVSQEKANNEGLKESSDMGILFDKKQF